MTVALCDRGGCKEEAEYVVTVEQLEDNPIFACQEHLSEAERTAVWLPRILAADKTHQIKTEADEGLTYTICSVEQHFVP